MGGGKRTIDLPFAIGENVQIIVICYNSTTRDKKHMV